MKGQIITLVMRNFTIDIIMVEDGRHQLNWVEGTGR